MQYKLSITLEQESGVNVSKDSLAEEIIAQQEGNELELDESLSLKILNFEFLGSKQGKPLQFLMELEDPSIAGELDFEDVGSAIVELLEGEPVEVESDISDSMSEYTISQVDYEVI